MLSSLHIENIAVIGKADIELSGGFNVLTGETGAGKSIIIDSICALMGERAYRDILRTGEKRAVVSAVFSGVSHLPEADADGCLLITREIFLDGRNVCKINGLPSTLAGLRALGNELINIHGQHDGQKLMDDAYHLEYLDGFAQSGGLLEAYRESFAERRKISSELSRLRMDESEKQRLIDTLRFQVTELEAAKLRPGEDAELAAKKKEFQNAERLIGAVEAADAVLNGNEELPGAVSEVKRAARALESAAKYSDAVSTIFERFSELETLCADIADELWDVKRGLSFAPGDIDAIEQRLDTLYRLKRKYGATADDMLEYLEKCKKRLGEIELSDEAAAALEKRLREADAEAKKRASELSSLRKSAAKQLEGRVVTQLSQLDMPKVSFSVDFQKKELDETGGDEVSFLLSANAGEALKPLSRIASGGELSRIMLALKNVLAENDSVGTLIFDEVDAGVSGRAAEKVARKLRELSNTRQVVCVTHLPQIAAAAATHFCIEKTEREGRTFTTVSPLDGEGRARELARLISGSAVTENTLKSAREMLI